MSAALALEQTRGTGGYGYRRGTVYKAARSAAPRILISEAYPDEWTSEVIARLVRLKELEPGWDGYDGRPIDPSVVYFVYQMLEQVMRPDLPVPDIMPLAGGGLQIEWHRMGWDLEIEVSHPMEIHAWGHELATGNEKEVRLSTDFAKLEELLDRVADAPR